MWKQSCIKQTRSLTIAKVSARLPWYIGCNSLNQPSLHLGSPSKINVIYTSLKVLSMCWQWGSSFILLAVVASQTCQLVQNSEKIWTYSSSRSSKVDDFGTNRKHTYEFEFLLVTNSNFGPILHCFWDRPMATYLLKIAYFSYPYSTPYLPFGISRWS